MTNEDKYNQAVDALRYILQLKRGGTWLLPICLERTNAEYIVAVFDREKKAKEKAT